MSDENEKVKLPWRKELQRFFCNIFGRPFIYVEFEYNHKTEMLGVIFDYNNAMLNRIRQAGYDDDDPDDAIRHYIQRVMIMNHDVYEETDDAQDDGVDDDYDYDSEGTFVHERGER